VTPWTISLPDVTLWADVWLGLVVLVVVVVVFSTTVVFSPFGSTVLLRGIGLVATVELEEVTLLSTTGLGFTEALGGAVALFKTIGFSTTVLLVEVVFVTPVGIAVGLATGTVVLFIIMLLLRGIFVGALPFMLRIGNTDEVFTIGFATVMFVLVAWTVVFFSIWICSGIF